MFDQIDLELFSYRLIIKRSMITTKLIPKKNQNE